MDELINLDDLTNEIEEKGLAGFIDHVYLHWTAGHYGQHDSAYHLNIDRDGSLYLTKPLDETPAATWHRNYKSIAVAIDGCAGSGLWADGRVDFGPEPPTDAQVECLAQVVATLANALGLGINSDTFTTHAEAAELDGYGPNTTCERWDLWCMPGATGWGAGGDYIRGKALWYKQEWDENKEW
nr:MAG TPA: N-acetylmuramoyl-L-alanine amidase [Bacteriophage sp.]